MSFRVYPEGINFPADEGDNAKTLANRLDKVNSPMYPFSSPWIILFRLNMIAQRTTVDHFVVCPVSPDETLATHSIRRCCTYYWWPMPPLLPVVLLIALYKPEVKFTLLTSTSGSVASTGGSWSTDR